MIQCAQKEIGKGMAKKEKKDECMEIVHKPQKSRCC